MNLWFLDADSNGVRDWPPLSKVATRPGPFGCAALPAFAHRTRAPSFTRATGSDPYFLKTARIAFRCRSKDDLPLAMSLWGDPEVTKYLGGPFSPQEVRARLENEIATMEAHGIQYRPFFCCPASNTQVVAGCVRANWKSGSMSWESISAGLIGGAAWRSRHRAQSPSMPSRP